MRDLLLALCILSASFNGIAQNKQPGELLFNHLFVEDGLPEGLVRALIQDKEGYIWAGTQNGLVRYDGYKTKVYKFGPGEFHFINSIFEDRKGQLWIGIFPFGVYKYDRTTDSFTHFMQGPEQPDSLNSVDVRSIRDDRYGNLWIAGEDLDNNRMYIAAFNIETKTFKHYYDKKKELSEPKATVCYEIFEDSNGIKWFGTDNGLYEYKHENDKLIPHFITDNAAQQKAFAHFQQDASNPDIFWVNEWVQRPYKDELWQVNTKDNSVKKFGHDAKDHTSLPSDTIYAVLKDSRGRIWVGTNRGLSLFDPATGHFNNCMPQDGKQNLNGNAISEIKEDRNGNLWCATSYGGLLYFETKTGKFKRYAATSKNAEYGLADNYVHHLLIDRAGTPWFGAGRTGLQWINKGLSKTVLYKNDPGQQHNFPGGATQCFTEAPDSTFYIGTRHGLYHWQPGTDSFKLIQFDAYRNKDISVVCAAVDRQGLVWYGGFVADGNKYTGLLCFDPATGKTKQYLHNEKDSTSLSSDRSSYIFEDHSGILWIGTVGGGLCSFNRATQSFTRYPYIINNDLNTPNRGALDDDEVQNIFEDKNGTLWIGTNNGGLNEFNRISGRFTSYSNQLPGFACVLNIFEDNKARLWAGTYMGGLFLFDRKAKTSKKFSEKDGLLYDGSSGIFDDDKNNVWVVSFRGISIIDAATNKIRTLTKNGSLPDEQLTRSAIKTSKGSFLITTKNGFLLLNPNEFVPDTNTPYVHIEAVDFTNPAGKKDSSIFTYGKSRIELHYNENRISFHYIGLQYQNPELTQYTYKLDGYDKDWIQAGTLRNAVYTNLSPGTYTFHVRAANSDGVWSQKEDSITIVISPPWWETWWFRVLSVIGLAVVIYAIIKERSKKLTAENLLLEQKVTERTAQLKKSFEEIKSTQAQLIQSEKMASLGELTAGIAHEIQNPLNFVNNFSEVNNELISELVDEVDKGNYNEVKAIAGDIRENEQKINHHGKRADAIVKSMLQHSRTSSGVKQSTDINALCDEYLRLAYHGLRAKDKNFNAELTTNFYESIGKINVVPQDIGRVLLNLFNNAFYAVNEKAKLSGISYQVSAENSMLKAESSNYVPTVTVVTRNLDNKVEIQVKDNGPGISQNIVDKIFQPFFTTKPTGQGTGLGLSLAYDIIKAHGGEIKVGTPLAGPAGGEDEGATFIVRLPVQ